MLGRIQDRLRRVSLCVTLTGIVALPLLFVSCNQPADESPRLVVVYTTCSLNKDYIAPYSADAIYTPNLKRFAEKSRVFARHHTEAGESGIAFASIYTGGDVRTHEVYHHPSRIPNEIEMLSESLHAAGYDTHFWDAHEMSSKRFNYGQGVDFEQVYQGLLRDKSAPFVRILERLAQDPTYKVAIIHNNAIPHWPYANPDMVAGFGKHYPEHTRDVDWKRASKMHLLFQEQMLELQYNYPETIEKLGLSGDDADQLAAYLEAAYKTQINILDGIFGGVMDAIREAGLEDDSLVAFTSDHGELMYRENAPFKWTHSFQLSHEVMNVPLIIRSGRLGIPSKPYDAVTRSIDLAPTLTGLLGLEFEDRPDSVDLSRAVLGKEPEPALKAWFHTSFAPEVWSEEETEQWKDITLANSLFPGYKPETIWVGLRDGDTLFKHRTLDGTNYVCEAYDLAADPWEQNDLFDPELPAHAEARTMLGEYKAGLVEAFAAHVVENDPELDEKRLEALKSLGYVQ